MDNRIEATEYTRMDGLKLIKLANGLWVIRKINGPAWFLDPKDRTWVIGTRADFKLDDHGMHFDHAMELFQTLSELLGAHSVLASKGYPDGPDSSA